MIHTISKVLVNTINEIELSNDKNRRELFTYSGNKNYKKLIEGSINGRLAILSPRTCKGRSALTLGKAYDLAKEGIKVGYLSSRKSPKELLYQIVANQSPLPLSNFIHGSENTAIKVLRNISSQLEVPLLVCNNKVEPDERVLDDCKKMVMKGAEVIIVDCLETLTTQHTFDIAELEKRDLPTENLSALSVFIEFASKYNVSLAMVV